MKRYYSLKDKKRIDEIFQKKQSVGNRYFALYFDTHNHIHFQYAISIGRKYGNAVERNLMKRRIRNIVSDHKNQFKKELAFVIVVKPNANTLKYNNILKSIKTLFVKGKIIEKEEDENAENA